MERLFWMQGLFFVPHVAVHSGTWILIWGGSIRETVAMMVVQVSWRWGWGAELLCYLRVVVSSVCCSFLLGSVMCVPKVFLTSGAPCVCLLPEVWEGGAWQVAAELAKLLPQMGRIWLEWELPREASDAALMQPSDLTQSRDGISVPVLGEAGRVCDSSFLHQNLANHSELRSYPGYGAVFVICEAEHLPGEEDLSGPAGRMSACLRQWQLRVLVPLNWICWGKPSPVSYWFYAQDSLAASHPFQTEIASHCRESFSEVVKCPLCKGKLLKI